MGRIGINMEREWSSQKCLFVLVFVLMLCVTLGETALTQTEHYDHKEVLSASYVLYWNVRVDKITFETHVETTGYVGFGLSRDGKMTGSDVIIGGVNDVDNSTYFKDRYASGQFLPAVDDSQDWTLVKAWQQDGFTGLKFTRSLLTCDKEKDRNITAGVTYVIWSYSDSDNLTYHGSSRRGSQRLTLLLYQNDFPNLPQDALKYNFIMSNVPVTVSDSEYYCKGFRIPDALTEKKNHLIRFDPLIQDGNMEFIRQINMYACHFDVGDMYHDRRYKCGAVESDNPSSQCITPVAVWSAGEKNYTFPENVGIPFGDGHFRFLTLQIHYDNPERKEGVFDSSGLSLWFTPTIRKYDGGMVTLGVNPGRHHVIPPRQDQFTTRGWCHNMCINQNEMNIVTSFPHANPLSTAVHLRHLRDREEQEFIAYNNNYNFYFRNTQQRSQPAKVMKGDTLMAECVYNSTGQTDLTLGGLSKNEEQCIITVLYYPRNNLSQCLSSSTPATLLKGIPGLVFDANSTHVNITEPPAYMGLDVWGVLRRQNWSDTEFSRRYQKESLMGSINNFCVLGTNGTVVETEVPEINKIYKIPPVCGPDGRESPSSSPPPGRVAPGLLACCFYFVIAATQTNL